MARKKEYPGGFRLTLATAQRLAVQEFGTAKGLEPDRGTCLEGFFTMQMGNMGVSISPDLGMSGCIMVRAGLCTATLTAHEGTRHASETLVVGRQVRRLTPLECERLQGYPDGWTDVGPWTDSAGKLHKESSDSARYKALGNSIALPPWSWVLKRLCACYERDATMASLFDGIGGFPLIWERLNGPGSCLWASEIEEFPIAVTKTRFDGKRRW